MGREDEPVAKATARLMSLKRRLLLAAWVAALPTALVAQAAWRVDAAPTLDLASSSKSGAVLFAHVTSATRLQDGTIVVADRDDNALHYFDVTGKPLRTAGRISQSAYAAEGSGEAHPRGACDSHFSAGVGREHGGQDWSTVR